MANGKVRAQAHITDSKAIAFVKNQLPEEWVVRELSPDYGIDLDVEVFQQENNQVVTLGEHLFLQVKGTENARYKDASIKTKKGTVTEKHLCFSLDTDLLKLVERSGNSTSVMLVTVDLVAQQAYFVCLNDYIDCVLCNDPNWRAQARKTIYVPVNNRLGWTAVLRWYSIRGKLLSFFCEAKALESKIMHWCDAAKYISTVHNYVEKIRCSDVWKTSELGFGLLRPAYRIMQIITNHGYLPEYDEVFDDDEDTRYTNSPFIDITANEVKQIMSCRRLFESIDTANAMFFDDLKPMYVPSEYHAWQKLYQEGIE